jgi:glycosyltransferase involved in cell wall biosynthesis
VTRPLEKRGEIGRDGSLSKHGRIQLMYFTPSDLLIPRVDRHCIMRFCEAVSALGVDVEAVSLNVSLEFDEPTRSRGLFDVYGVRTPFAVTVLPTSVHQATSDGASSTWRALTYSAHAFWRLLATRRAFAYDCTLIYFKNYLLGPPFLVLRKLLGKRVLLLFEIHVPPSNWLGRRLLPRLDGVIPVSRVLARELRAQFGIEDQRILVAHMGVSLRYLEEVRITKEQARHRLGLPQDRKLVVYTGKVHTQSREIDLLVETAELLTNEAEVVIVGGREDQVAQLRDRLRRQQITNVRIPGFVAPADVFPWQLAADALVMYYPSELSINKYRASPGKLFEYMAAKRPIVTADFPALREALGPDAALFVEKDNPDALAAGIRAVLGDEDLGERLAGQAYRDVHAFTWERRAERVLAFSQQLRRLERRVMI